jgi:5'-methylthioadenosine phosphorylase
MSVTIGIVGGSGLYDMAELTDREERAVKTPFGEPSAPYVVATLRGRRVAFLARHGRGHRLLPSELNFRANIYGFKELGVEWILSASAVGSPARGLSSDGSRGAGSILSIARAAASARSLATASWDTSDSRTRSASRCRTSCIRPRKDAGAQVHRGGTYVCMEGRSFRRWPSRTRTGSRLRHHRHDQPAGGQARARSGDCYTTLALVTDYDCWHPDHDSVTVDMIIRNLTENARWRSR